MAKSSKVQQPQKEHKTATTCPPELYWPYCTSEESGPTINRKNSFPFAYLHELENSIKTYPESSKETKQATHHLVDSRFMQEFCSSELVIIIQKSFSASHLNAITNAMKESAKNANLETKKLVIITSKQLNAKYVGNKGAFHILQGTKLFEKPNYDFHDRIVILDGNIWHFGATVCCMHQAPQAYTGPWEDRDSAFLKFIQTFVRF